MATRNVKAGCHCWLVQQCLALVVVLTICVGTLVAQEQKPDEQPVVLLCNPLGVLPGETVKVVARGLRLEGVTEVKSSDGRVMLKLLSQGKTGVPQNQDVKRTGDNQVEFEIVVPGDLPVGNLELTFITPKGEAKYTLPVGGEVPTIREVEPNAGFKQPQKLQLPQLVIGSIEGNHDVDVYSIEFAAGEKITCEVFAWRLGSAVDASLAIYDSSGRVLASCDDTKDSRDPRIEFTAGAAGTYFVVVQDANDLGGPASPYRLGVRR